MQTVTTGHRFWALWLILLGAKVWIATRLPLFGDEAWYWLEGQHLAWAYSDLPGFTAWLARFGVETGGHSSLGLRWPFIALAMAVPLLVRASARRWFDARSGDRAGTWALLLPLLGGLGFLALPDVPLTLAAALCLYAALRLCVRVDAAAAFWLMTGLAMGALSHYRFLPLILAGGLGLLLDAGGRRALRNVRVWVAVGVGALAWLPLLLWNVRHGDAGLHFQLLERHPWALHAEGAWLPASQLFLVTPLLLVALIAGFRMVWRRWREGEAGPWGLILGASILPLVLYLGLAFVADRERISFHWLLQAWLPLLVIVPRVLERWSPGWRSATGALAVAGLLLVLGYTQMATVPSGRRLLADSTAYPDNFAGWTEIATMVRAVPGVMDGRVELVADNFKLGAQLAFALRQPGLRVLDHRLNHKHGRAMQLGLWGQQASLIEPATKPRLLVVEDSAIPRRDRQAYYRALCEQSPHARLLHEVEVDDGTKGFALFVLDETGPGRVGCTVPTENTTPSPP
jgi:4-amino-4-deoxy-L-arabinose transferase-like glycosyltransferase